MKIAIGTVNPAKVEAVKETLASYPLFDEAEILAVKVGSGVSEQPLTLEEIIEGAKTRAKRAQEGVEFGIGIESGLFPAPGTLSGYLEATICCIWDGENLHTGLSSGFELPPVILHHVLDDGLDLAEACLKSGVSKDPNLGSGEGFVGILTNGRVNRKAYTKQAITMALAQLEHLHLYRP